jgi:transposase
MRRKAYRATDVKDVRLEEVLKRAPAGAVTAGVDIGKEAIYGVVRWSDGSFERPWKAKNPAEVATLVGVLRALAGRRELIVAMESTGSYGEPLHSKLAEAGLTVHRVGGKAAHDYAEVFDGVPSQHDGKDAAVIAELAAFGKSTPWPFRAKSAWEAEMAFWVDWLDIQQNLQRMWIGRLEALLARHWPEATRVLEFSSMTLLRALAHYGGPADLAKDRQASARLASWGGYWLRKEKIEKFLASAAQTVGVPQGAEEVRRMQQYAAMALAARGETRKARGELKRLAAGNEAIQRQAKAVGIGTACVLWVMLGDPKDYSCGEAYRKAMGLNLKERSSGKHQGMLKISKRGPSIVRRWMYFAALRTAQSAFVKPWYEAKKAKDKDRGHGALIAIARKLALALHAVGARGTTFEPWRLFSQKVLVGKQQQAKQRAARSRSNSGREVLVGMGAPPPNPRDLSPGANPGDKKSARGRTPPPPSPVLAPGSALGSVPTVALSSAQVKRV